MSLVPGSRFPSHPYQGPQYYPPKHMGVMHASVLVYVNSTPAVVVKDVDDYGSLFSVNLAGGTVAGGTFSDTYVPQGGSYSYGTSIAAGAKLGAVTFSGSPYSLTFAYFADFVIDDTADTAVQHVDLAPGGTVGYGIEVGMGAAAGGAVWYRGTLGAYVSYAGGSGSYSFNVATNETATTANCTIYLSIVTISVMDFVPGPGTVGESW